MCGGRAGRPVREEGRLPVWVYPKRKKEATRMSRAALWGKRRFGGQAWHRGLMMEGSRM